MSYRDALDDTPAEWEGAAGGPGASPRPTTAAGAGEEGTAPTAAAGPGGQPPAGLDLAAIRAKLDGLTGPRYWRGLEEVAETPAFRELLRREFPRQAAEWTDTLSRREFVQLMGASLALAGLSACTRDPVEKIVPYVQSPEEIILGQPLSYATALTEGGLATGVLVESHLGRPTKIEGNALHPASLGATDARAQAAILGLYDPDRSQVVTNRGAVRPWSSFLAALTDALAAQEPKKGVGLRLLTGAVTSPTLAAQIREILARYPGAAWHQYEPVNRDAARRASRAAFDRFVDARYDLAQADVILALDADFLGSGPGHVRYIRDFAGRRGGPPDRPEMNRLYVIESTFSTTGARADHRLALGPRLVDAAAEALAAAVTRGLDAVDPAGAPAPLQPHAPWLAALLRDLRAHSGRSLVIPGETASAAVHAWAHLMNDALGNVGRTVVYTEPVEAEPVVQTESLAALVRAMSHGAVDVLALVGGNPAFDAPGDLEFARHLEKVAFRVHLGLYEDETSALCHWHIPQAHELEAWSDARAWDGTITIQQPLIAPLYQGRSAHEFLAAFSGQPARSGYEIVRDAWLRTNGPGRFEEFWRQALHDGVVAGSARPAVAVSVRPGFLSPGARPLDGPAPPSEGLELVLRPDPNVHDGRFANNAWLQELPRPITRLTWENAVWVAPALAARQGLVNGDVVHLAAGDAGVQGPVWIVPGLPPETVTVHVGHGRPRAGRVGKGAGFDAYPLLHSVEGWSRAGLRLVPTGRRQRLACAQEHHSMEGRHLIRSATLARHREHPEWARELGETPDPSLTLYPPQRREGNAWGMSIDLSACVGCNACVLACQAENNIPVVGKDQVLRGREMHWIRIDRYFEGDLDAPAVHHQPVPCMQCENAPCEPVCPVGATVHSHEGLNDMVYNRCVGTRYCSNNCPYKVRRFNFLQYSDQKTESLKLLANPDVTVRTRGVMEKCTYCVQRINAARIDAHRAGRPVRDGEITPACAQVCPARAIVFGDVNDPASRVSALKASPLDYGLLADLNTRPRTTYLAELRNPNPAIDGHAGGRAPSEAAPAAPGHAGRPPESGGS